ncbi:hypothetical protein GM668_13205 [Duganella ginsengisoli]|uniref:Uncharacterized protein n=2 Tax=Pseudoduganella ginsengisoli TaxID=1462440 RepID=A0A6L6PZH3_9BURK|nr:hypothetical protein [Pseudoduganella ginsengisoli]
MKPQPPQAHSHGYDEGHEHDHLHAPRRPLPDMSHIQGWGADLDRKNRPAVPMERTPPRLDVQPLPLKQQPPSVEVLVSPEHLDGLTPVFGTTAPPKGLSGWLRRQAYKMTENDVRHFLMLVLADRVDMVEGLGEDLARGHVPNVLAEMGIKAEWQHNKAGLVRKAAVTAAAGAALYWLLRRRGRD